MVSFSSTEKSPAKVSATPLVTAISTPLSETATLKLSPSTPDTQEALTVVAKHTYHLNPAFPTPKIHDDDEVLIRTYAVGLNPIDWKSVDWNFCLPEYPWVTGREMSGVVEQVGNNVSGLTVGTRVWTSTYYRDIRSGCFQQYVIAPQHTVKRIPDTIDFEAAACLGVCGLTAAMTMWKWLQVPIHTSAQPTIQGNRRFLLVWGGSSITGQFAIQIAAYSGLEVIAVASKKTAVLVRELGSTWVVTRDEKTDDEIVAEIRGIVGDELTLAADIVGPSTAASCVAALSSRLPSKIAPLSFLPKGHVVPRNVTVADVEMKWFILDKGNERYAVELNRLVAEGVVKMPELEVLEGGLGRVEEGLEMQRRGDRAGKKIVVSLRR
ncbi:GroES-like protein [Pyrenochaeta sp. DS3sAY3a]|nr:GroES-like protein [Pyrenochaeta sp. DS3sAY3a]